MNLKKKLLNALLLTGGIFFVTTNVYAAEATCESKISATQSGNVTSYIYNEKSYDKWEWGYDFNAITTKVNNEYIPALITLGQDNTVHFDGEVTGNVYYQLVTIPESQSNTISNDYGAYYNYLAAEYKYINTVKDTYRGITNKNYGSLEECNKQAETISKNIENSKKIINDNYKEIIKYETNAKKIYESLPKYDEAKWKQTVLSALNTITYTYQENSILWIDATVNNVRVKRAFVLGKSLSGTPINVLQTKDSTASLGINDIKDTTNYSLTKQTLNTDSKEFKEIDKRITGKSKMVVYNINLLKDNKKVQPDKEVTLTVDLPENFDKDRIAVYRVDDDGKITLLTSAISSGLLTKTRVAINTNHFSYYVIAEASTKISDILKVDNGTKTIETSILKLADSNKTPVVETPKEQENNTSTEKTVENPKTGYFISGAFILIGVVSFFGIKYYTKKNNKFIRL